jgi:hypothetical protein
MSDDFESKFGAKLPQSLAQLYRTGGQWLVLVFVGISCMTSAFFYSRQLSQLLFIVGAVVTVVCLGLYVWTQLKEPLAARKDAGNAAAVENLAVELTNTVDALQGLCIKHMEFVESVLGRSVETLKYLPRLEKALRDLGVSNPRQIPSLIVDVSKLSKGAIDEIKIALNKKDSKNLIKQAKVLATIRQEINRVLSSPELFADL